MFRNHGLLHGLYPPTKMSLPHSVPTGNLCIEWHVYKVQYRHFQYFAEVSGLYAFGLNAPDHIQCTRLKSHFSLHTSSSCSHPHSNQPCFISLATTAHTSLFFQCINCFWKDLYLLTHIFVFPVLFGKIKSFCCLTSLTSQSFLQKKQRLSSSSEGVHLNNT